jgi:hypothetical protein
MRLEYRLETRYKSCFMKIKKKFGLNLISFIISDHKKI